MLSLPCMARFGTTCCYKILLFAIIFFSFAALHASRTCWSYVKLQVADDFDYSEKFLGVIDMVFLFTYSFGLFFSGNLGDKFHRARLYALGMLINLFCYLTIAALGWKGEADKFIFLFIFIISGLAQSVGFPNSVAMIKDWYVMKNILMCIFILSSNVGNVIGQQFGAIFGSESKENWPNAIWAVCFVLLFCNIVMATVVIPTPQLLEAPEQPRKPDLASAATSSVSSAGSGDSQQKKENMRAITLVEAFRIKGLYVYAGANACIRAVLFGMVNWLPAYLKTVADLGNSSANYLLAWEIGIMGGCLFAGILTTRFKKYVLIMTSSLALSAVMFVLVFVFQDQATSPVFPVLLFCAAFFLGIPAALIATVATNGLAEEAQATLNIEAAGTLVGIVDSVGALSGGIFQLIIPMIKHQLFVVEAGLFALAVIIMLPVCCKEVCKKKVDASEKFALPRNFEMAVEENDDQ